MRVMSKNAVSWTVLGVLFGFAMLGFGIKQGMNVGEENARNKIKHERDVEKLTPTATPKPTSVIGYKITFDGECGVSYLLPENISSREANVSLVCNRRTASQEAALKKNGYALTTLPNKRVWIKSENHLGELIRRTIETLDE